MQSQNSTHKLALRGLLIAVCFILSWLESKLPVFTTPGMKLGITNITILIALYKLGNKDAFAINTVRIILVGFTFGNIFSLLYSLSGGLLSCLIMILLKSTTKFKIVTISMVGGLSHNIGQIIMAMIILQTNGVIYYLPILWFGGIMSGILVGLIGGLTLTRIRINV